MGDSSTTLGDAAQESLSGGSVDGEYELGGVVGSSRLLTTGEESRACCSKRAPREVNYYLQGSLAGSALVSGTTCTSLNEKKVLTSSCYHSTLHYWKV